MKETYQPIIGLEVHICLNTKSKMFCSCLNELDKSQPNLNICPICLGHPGTLPTINEEAIKKVVKTGLAFNCKIPEYSKFDRKNYFYPDLPKGYQISQHEAPISKGGYFKIKNKKIRIRRIHLEEDAGKFLHLEGSDYSLIDFNRAGVPLMELVTEPDINSAEEAKEFAEELQLILRYLEVSEADMEKGQFRVEANISLLKNKNQNSGKVEIKNLNSFRVLEKAINYEIERQTKILKTGKKVAQETRGWDENKEITIGQREKEEAYDYRYFPEPDLPVIHLQKKFINEIKTEIPELPQQKRERFKKEYQLDEKIIEFFVSNRDFGEYFEKTMSKLNQWMKEIKIKKDIEKEEFKKLSKLCSNYIITDLQGLLRGISVEDKDFLITPENFAEFIILIYEEKISSKIAKIVLKQMFETGANSSQIIKEKGLIQITDETKIEKIIKKVILKNPQAVKDFKAGKKNAFQFLVGQVMSVSKGKASPQKVNQELDKFLKSDKI